MRDSIRFVMLDKAYQDFALSMHHDLNERRARLEHLWKRRIRAWRDLQSAMRMLRFADDT